MNDEIIKHILDPRQPKFKKVATLRPFCPICKLELRGNNSGISPYECDCGEWTTDFTKVGYWRIKTKAL